MKDIVVDKKKYLSMKWIVIISSVIGGISLLGLLYLIDGYALYMLDLALIISAVS